MTLEEIKQYCLAKTGATEDYPFGPEPLVYKVGSKMFVIVSVRHEKISMSLKCDPFIAESLRQEFPSITPGYHLNKSHWNSVSIDGAVPEKELKWMIDHSYDLVYKTLTKTEQQRLQCV
jgi:predicted DNA-binding protein (MmcQ/YjbR family)